MPWARDKVRGRPSRLIAVTPPSASRAASCGSVSGDSIPITAWPGLRSPDCAWSGLVTVRMTSAVLYRSSRLTTLAPASMYELSGNQEPSPAPDSTSTSSPACVSFATLSGTRATRRSPGALSFTTATFIDATFSASSRGPDNVSTLSRVGAEAVGPTVLQVADELLTGCELHLSSGAVVGAQQIADLLPGGDHGVGVQAPRGTAEALDGPGNRDGGEHPSLRA